MEHTTHYSKNRLLSAVGHELGWTADLNTDHIRLSVTDGALTLSGTVDSHPDRRAAVAAALRVAGVRAVADELVVSPPSEQEDTEIAACANRVLNDSTVIPHNVRATVRAHHVTLTGEVVSNHQSSAAARLIEDLRGVTSVYNDIRIAPDRRTFGTCADEHGRRR